jgi:hypothetical protein
MLSVGICMDQINILELYDSDLNDLSTIQFIVYFLSFVLSASVILGPGSNFSSNAFSSLP